MSKKVIFLEKFKMSRNNDFKPEAALTHSFSRLIIRGFSDVYGNSMFLAILRQVMAFY
ncbi:MAG: hypothetical protein PF693_18285 [Spirochaetia bacterium]|jgi:hypothetical protein|nr:hypothetical protein [Spirochaetia bacterium]